MALLIGGRALAQAPTVDQILDKYVEAIGGKAAFDKLTSRVMIGSFENPARGLIVPFEVYAKAPDIRVEITGFAEASQGFNGVVGWSMNVTENGLRELTGPALHYARLAMAGKAKVGDREAYAAGETSFEDYRAVDGIKLPFTIRQKLPNGAGIILNRFREIKHNVPIDDAKFSVPTP